MTCANTKTLLETISARPRRICISAESVSGLSLYANGNFVNRKTQLNARLSRPRLSRTRKSIMVTE